jgi:LacI family transcriptional regulator
MPKLTRIAFVPMLAADYCHRIMQGVCAFANPRQGFIVREFPVSPKANERPVGLESWRPDAVIAFLGVAETELLNSLAERLPVVNTARSVPRPNVALVLADAFSMYAAVTEHLQNHGIAHIEQVVLGRDASSQSNQALYAEFCRARGEPARSFVIDEELPGIFGSKPVSAPPRALASWLRGLPRPSGIFTQQTYAGPYLCRACKCLSVNVPDDIAMIGADDFDVSLWCDPPLTSVRLPAQEVGVAAARHLAEVLAGTAQLADEIRVPGAEVVSRGSTARVSATGFNPKAAIQFIRRHACDRTCFEITVDR